METTSVKKPTKKELFARLLNLPSVQADPELVAFAKHEIELLDKKSASGHKPTQKQKDNEVLKQAILDGLEPGEDYTVSAIQKTVPECAELSNQKTTSLLTQLVADHLLNRRVEKRTPVYSLVEE